MDKRTRIFRVKELCLLVMLGLLSCTQNPAQEKGNIEAATIAPAPQKKVWTDPQGDRVKTRFLLPADYVRSEEAPGSFASYLRDLPLKPEGSLVHYFDGRTKATQTVYDAVVDLPIGKRDLHQCADAVMRLKAEYHFKRKEYDKIHFNFTNGFRVDYSEWRKGKRMVVKGNKSYWSQSANPSDTYTSFWKYLEIIFSYAGTLSLEKELQSVELDQLQIGDVFIQGGSPGHAVLIVDKAFHTETDTPIFLLAQSYMPAQEIQILKNPNGEGMGPWYSTDFGETLRTPEWRFQKEDLKRFP